MSKRKQVRTIAAQGLKSVGYFFCLLEWLWLAVLAVPFLIESGVLESFQPTQAPVQPDPQFMGEPSPLVMVFVGAVTIGVLIITVLVLLRLPRTIARGGDVIVESTTKAVLPVVTHHKKLPARKQRIISARVAFGIQLLLTVVPLMGILAFPAIDDLPKDVIAITGSALAFMSLLLFSAAYKLRLT